MDICNEIASSDLNLIHKYSGKVLEKYDISNYELALIDFGFAGKTVSLTSNNQPYWQQGAQDKKPSLNKKGDQISSIRKMIEIVKKWVNKYGRLTIGSDNKTRTKYYHNWFSKDMKCSDIFSGGYNPLTNSEMFGFNITNNLDEIRVVPKRKLIATKSYGGTSSRSYRVDMGNE